MMDRMSGNGVEQRVAQDILVFGRSPIRTASGTWALSEMGKARVAAVATYLTANQRYLRGPVRVQFSAGWIGTEDAPPMVYREAVLMDAYADKLGLKKIGSDTFTVQFAVQPNSCSTISDAVLSAQSGFFGNRPFSYTIQKPLAVVSHLGPRGTPGHMGRCLDAAERAFRVRRGALLPIAASGEDTLISKSSEQLLRRLSRMGTLFSYSYRSLLLRDHIMLLLSKLTPG
jgi:hypothetical protein